MGLFVYPHTVDLHSRVNTLNSANQYSYTWNLTTSKVKCRYSPTALTSRREGIFEAQPVKVPNESMAILFPASVVVVESDQLFNILDKRGNLLEIGPLTIHSIVNITTWDGVKHHAVARVRRIEAK